MRKGKDLSSLMQNLFMAASVDFSNYLFLFIGIVLVPLVSFFLGNFTSSRTKIRNPPGPRGFPLFGHLHLLKSALPKSLETLAHRYGPLMYIRIGPLPVVVVSSAALAKEILKTHDIDFASKFVFTALHRNIYEGSEFINACYGPYWRFMKKLCMTKLFAGPQLERFIHIREQETIRLVQSLMSCSEKGEACDLRAELRTLTNNMICRMAMSKRCSANPNQADEITKIVREIMESGAKLSFIEGFGPLKRLDLSGKGKKLQAALWKYDHMADQIIQDYKDDKVKGDADQEKDLMDMLLETYEDPDAEMKLTKMQIKYFFLEIFMAGVDTTSASTQWAMIELINHPQMFKKLRDEIGSVVGFNRLVKESDVPNLPYLQAIVKETLRRHPPGTLLRRKCNKDCIIDGYDIKAGTNILINAYAIMRDPNTWKDPDDFVPERFMIIKNTKNFGKNLMDMKDQDFHYLPFGSGRRACLGAAHASVVMHAAIAVLVQCFDFKFKEGEDADIKVATGYTGAVARSILCYPIAQCNPLKDY